MRPPRILVTRSPHQASALAEHLRTLGAEPILIPTIELADPISFAPLDAALRNLDQFHWLLFTSANAVGAFHRRLEALGLTVEDRSPHSKSVILSEVEERSGGAQPKDLQPIPDPAFPLIPFNLKIAAIGSATAKALATIGLAASLIPPQAIAESLTDVLLPHALQPDGTPTRFLLVRAEEAREHLPETLRAAGAEVTVALAYRTVIPAGSINAIRDLFSCPENYPDAITFTSTSTVRNFFALLDAAGVIFPLPAPVEIVVLASVGPVTSAALRDHGHAPQVESPTADIRAFGETLVSNLNLKKDP